MTHAGFNYCDNGLSLMSIHAVFDGLLLGGAIALGTNSGGVAVLLGLCPAIVLAAAAIQHREPARWFAAALVVIAITLTGVTIL